MSPHLGITIYFDFYNNEHFDKLLNYKVPSEINKKESVKSLFTILGMKNEKT